MALALLTKIFQLDSQGLLSPRAKTGDHSPQHTFIQSPPPPPFDQHMGTLMNTRGITTNSIITDAEHNGQWPFVRVCNWHILARFLMTSPRDFPSALLGWGSEVGGGGGLDGNAVNGRAAGRGIGGGTAEEGSSSSGRSRSICCFPDDCR